MTPTPPRDDRTSGVFHGREVGVRSIPTWSLMTLLLSTTIVHAEVPRRPDRIERYYFQGDPENAHRLVRRGDGSPARSPTPTRPRIIVREYHFQTPQPEPVRPPASDSPPAKEIVVPPPEQALKTTGDVCAEPTGLLKGTLKSSSIGSPRPRVRLSFQDRNTRHADVAASTDSEGRFEVVLPPGTWFVYEILGTGGPRFLSAVVVDGNQQPIQLTD